MATTHYALFVPALTDKVTESMTGIAENFPKIDTALDGINTRTSNVTNTSDANKPVSAATQTALNLKATTTDVGAIAGLTTTIKTSIVNAINWLYGIVGNVTTLTTTVKTSCVAAINELVISLSNKEPKLPTGGTSSDVLLGNKTWFNIMTNVRGTLLTGATFLTNSVVLVTDTVLVAIGKLQAQITNLVTPRSSFIIAPSNAVNKERADLTLTGINDALAINDALTALYTLRGAGTQAIRVDFLGGDIVVEEQIDLPDNCKVYGNGVRLTAKPASEDYYFDGEAVVGTPPFTGSLLKGVNNVDVDGFILELEIDYYMCTCTTGILINTGNVSKCTVGEVNNGGYGIQVSTGNVSNCTVGEVSSYGIQVSTGNVSNCTVGDANGYGIQVSTGNVSNCTVGEVNNGGCGIYVEAGVNDIICGNKILSENGSGTRGIFVIGTACLVTGNVIGGTITSPAVGITISGANTVKKNNIVGGVYVA